MSPHDTPSTIGVALVAAILNALLSMGVRGQVDVDHVPFAAAGNDMWFVWPVDQSSDTWRLHHHGSAMGGPFFRTPATLDVYPVAVAATEHRAWLVFDQRDGAVIVSRSVHTLEARMNPATGLYFYVPPNGLTLESPLPPSGRVLGLAAGEFGVWAALTDDTSQVVRLFRHEAESWTEQTVPGEVVATPVDWLALGIEDSGETPVLIGRGTTGTLQFARPSSAGAWAWSITSLRAGRVVFMGSSLGRPAFGLVTEGDPNSISVVVLKGNHLLPIVEINTGATRFGLASNRRGLMSIRPDASKSIVLQTWSPVSGEAIEAQTLVSEPLTSATRLFLPYLMLILTGFMVAVVLVRPVPRTEEVSLPTGMALAPLGRRAGALLIDLLPSVGLAMLITGSSPEELTLLPMWSLGGDASYESLLAIFITGVHSAVGELFWQRSLGKAIVRIVVVRLDGSPPRVWQVLLRNVLKVVTLAMPPIAMIVLLNQLRMRIGDLAARTLVVVPARQD